MKIILDTLEKVIKINESVTLGEFFETIERMLPMGEWKGFKLEVNVSINLQWVTPIILKEYINPISPIPCPSYPYPSYPWYTPIHDPSDIPYITMKTDRLLTGRYCIEA